MEISDFTHIGSRDYQEDRFRVLKNFAKRDELTLLVVCDGHGGKAAAIWLVDRFGEVLQDLVIKNPANKKYTLLMKEALEKCVDEWDTKCFGDQLSKIKNKDDKKQFFQSRSSKEVSRWQDNELESGSTICACLIDLSERMLHILHVGDSRVTWICDKKLIGSTVDHCVPTYMPPIENFPFVYGDGYVQDDLAMCRSFGDNTEKLFRVISRVPDLLVVQLGQSESRVVVATDGLFDSVTNHDVLYNELLDAKTIAHQVPKFDDNITVVYVKIPAMKMPQESKEKQPIKDKPRSRKSIKKRTSEAPSSEKEQEQAKPTETFENMLQNLNLDNSDKKKKLTKKKHSR